MQSRLGLNQTAKPPGGPARVRTASKQRCVCRNSCTRVCRVRAPRTRLKYVVVAPPARGPEWNTNT
eukprot:7304187-Prymnesium_polylepis.1